MAQENPGREVPAFFVQRRRLLSLMPVSEDPFHEKSGDEPAGKIVQADDPADVPAGFSVIPGTEIAFLEKAAGDIFAGQDEPGINASPDWPGQPPGQAEDGS